MIQTEGLRQPVVQLSNFNRCHPHKYGVYSRLSPKTTGSVDRQFVKGRVVTYCDTPSLPTGLDFYRTHICACGLHIVYDDQQVGVSRSRTGNLSVPKQVRPLNGSMLWCIGSEGTSNPNFGVLGRDRLLYLHLRRRLKTLLKTKNCTRGGEGGMTKEEQGRT